MPGMKDRRPLTEEEKKTAARLKEIYVREKADWKARGRSLTYQVMAEQLDVGTPGAIGQYMNANIPLNFENAIKFARFFNVSLKDISPRLAEQYSGVTLSDPNTAPAPAAKGEIPLISWVQAGAWQEISDLYETGEAERWVLCDQPHGSMAFALRVRGESMRDPTGQRSFDDGDIIHVDPERPYGNGSLVVVRVNGDNEATFKQLVLEGGRKYLKALNPHWPNQIIEMPEDSVIAGVVIGKSVSYI